MKHIKKVCLFLGVGMFIFGAGNQQAEALSSSQSAIIVGQETNSEFGHVLYFPNSNSSKLTRISLNKARKFTSSDVKASWTTTIPNQPRQSIEADSFIFEMTFNGVNSTIEEFLEKGIEYHFSVSNDGQTFEDVTQSLIYDQDTQTYQVPGTFCGYRIDMVKTNPQAEIPDAFAVRATSSIKVDVTQLHAEQLQGQVGLVCWKDSKRPNEHPTDNYQNIFVIQPTIQGQVHYQKLDSAEKVPAWENSAPMAEVTVDLIEQTEAGPLVVASTQTDQTGFFSFTSTSSTPFAVSDSKNTLSIHVQKGQYTGWVLQDGRAQADLDPMISIGRLTDIVHHSNLYTTAVANTKWLAPYDTFLEEGKNAQDARFILTELKTVPSTTEPSPTTPSTADTPTAVTVPSSDVSVPLNETFSVSSQNERAVFQAAPLPKTGTKRSAGVTVAGGLLLLSCLGFYFYNVKQRKRVEHFSK